MSTVHFESRRIRPTKYPVVVLTEPTREQALRRFRELADAAANCEGVVVREGYRRIEIGNLRIAVRSES